METHLSDQQIPASNISELFYMNANRPELNENTLEFVTHLVLPLSLVL